MGKMYRCMQARLALPRGLYECLLLTSVQGSRSVQEGFRVRVDITGGTKKGHAAANARIIASMCVCLPACLSV